MEVVNVIDKEKLTTRVIVSRFHIGNVQSTVIAKIDEHQKRSFFKTEGLNIDKVWFESMLNLCLRENRKSEDKRISLYNYEIN